MGIGLVMFLKAAIVAITAALWDSWLALKKRKMLTLKPDPKTGIYVPDWRWQKAEDWAKRSFWALFAIFNLFALFVVLPSYWPE